MAKVLIISVIVPSYFRHNLLIKKIKDFEKIKNQNNLEVVFVLEYEDQQSVKLIKKSKIKNYKIIFNYGKHYYSFKNGLKKTKGNYIIHMGDDDYFIGNSFQKILNYLKKNSQIKWLIGDAIYIDNNGFVIRKFISKIKSFFLKRYNYNYLTMVNFIMTPSVVIEKNLLNSIGGFDKNFEYAQDYYCWLEAGSRFKPKIILDKLTKVTYNNLTFSGSFDFKRYLEFLFKIFSYQKNILLKLLQLFSVIYIVTHNFLIKKIFQIFKSSKKENNIIKLINKNNKNKKILHITRFFDPLSFGGIEEGIYNLNKKANKFKFSNDILCTGKTSKIFNMDNMNVMQCKETFSISNNVFSFELLRNYRKILYKYDFINLHFPYPFGDLIILLFLSKIRKQKIILTYHSDIIKQNFFLKYMYLLFFKNFFLKNIFLVNISSQEYLKVSALSSILMSKNFFIQKIGITDQKKSNFNFLSNEKILTFFKKNKKICFFIARDRHYKGIDTLLYILKKNTNKNFVICTPNKFISEYACDKKNILYFSKINTLEKLFIFKNSYIHLFPSDNKAESLGVTLIEAQMFGIPSIVYNIQTGVNVIIRHNYNGYEISKIDKNLYNKGFLDLYYNENLRNELSKNSRKNFLKNCSLNNYDDYYSFLNKN